MRSKTFYLFGLLAALAVTLLSPFLAYREAQRRAYETEAELALAYARDVGHRTDEAARQAFVGIGRIKRAGLTDCTPEAQALMRRIDLSSTYLQAIGQVRDGVIVCSSIGSTRMPLGDRTFETAAGVRVYLHVPVDGMGPDSLLGLERDGYAVLIHSDLPVDTSGARSGISIAIFHMDQPANSPPAVARGAVSPHWRAHLRDQRAVTFVDDTHLVAIVRSTKSATVALAALPASQLHEREKANAWRLVPAGLAAGLAFAAAILLLARRQMSIAAALRYALRHDEFFVVYQPLVNLQTGRLVGAEALLRMRRGTGELIGPDLFIPIAEENGLVGKLTERLLSLIARDIGMFLSEHPDFHIAVNIAAADLHSENLPSMLDDFLARSHAGPRNLVIEITERAFVDPDLARRTIARLRERGIEVAIDDFGTGYSSLSQLESLDLDLLKIDRAFIQSIGTGAPTSQVVGYIIAMAQRIGLRMVAEGIETEEQASFMREHGVDVAQGWLFGRPMAFDALEREYLARQAEIAER
ncbi:EAL domain-containing protein [Pseudoduganella lutea]|nr:EAL domain-containing protein [Pseudoduganella lutea]